MGGEGQVSQEPGETGEPAENSQLLLLVYLASRRIECSYCGKALRCAACTWPGVLLAVLRMFAVCGLQFFLQLTVTLVSLARVQNSQLHSPVHCAESLSGSRTLYSVGPTELFPFKRTVSLEIHYSVVSSERKLQGYCTEAIVWSL